MPPRAYGEDQFRPLLDAIDAEGGELSAAAVCRVLDVKDKRNLARAVQGAIDLHLVHRIQHGPKAVYRRGPDPDSNDHLGDFEPSLWGDGTLVLHNCPVDGKGNPVMNRAQAACVKRLLTGDLV